MNSKAQASRSAARFCAAAAIWLGAFCAPAALAADNSTGATNANPAFKLAFMSSMFSEVNESDARAAMKVWILTVAKERNIAVDPDPHIFRTVDELITSNRTNRLDGVGVVAEEYVRLSQTMKFDRLGVGEYPSGIFEEYVVLVREDSGLDRIEQLQGRTLNVLSSPRMSLATVWLDTVLMEAGFKCCAGFFRQTNSNNKATLVTLPVFFRQVDACLTTRNSFKILGELNPQLAKQLHELAVSPPLLPACFAFCAKEQTPLRPEILNEMTHMENSPAGRQILTLVKSDRIVETPISSLDSALQLLAKHQRLCGETGTEPGAK